MPMNVGDVFYLIRQKSGAISNVDSDLVTGVLTRDYLNSLVLLLQNVYTPVLENQNLEVKLSESQVTSFLNTCKRFVDSLQKCGLILKDRLTLVVPEDEHVKKIP